MGRRKRWIAGWLAGAASAGLHAQDARVPAAPVQATAVPPSPAKPSVKPAGPAVPPKIEFRGADGKPLPPGIQRQLEERFRNAPRLPSQSLVTPPGGEGGDVVVTAQKPRGSVIGDIPPERTFNPIDIRAYGAGDVGELLQALGPQVSSSRGREDSGPVVLLNGKRVSSFAEIARIPRGDRADGGVSGRTGAQIRISGRSEGGQCGGLPYLDPLGRSVSLNVRKVF